MDRDFSESVGLVRLAPAPLAKLDKPLLNPACKVWLFACSLSSPITLVLVHEFNFLRRTTVRSPRQCIVFVLYTS